MIRQARDSDLKAITACAADAYGKYVSRIGKKPAPMVADFAGLIRAGKVHVAVDTDGRLRGFIVFFPRGDHMHLENVAVSEAYQGTGIGGRLIAHCEDSARRAGLGAIELYTNEKMMENLSLYPRLGYVETDRRSEDGFNRVFFRKELA